MKIRFNGHLSHILYCIQNLSKYGERKKLIDITMSGEIRRILNMRMESTMLCSSIPMR